MCLFVSSFKSCFSYTTCVVFLKAIVNVSMHVYMQTYTYAYIHTYIHTYTHIRTYMHTHPSIDLNHGIIQVSAGGGAGVIGSGRLLAAPPGNRSCVFVVGLVFALMRGVSCDIGRNLCWPSCVGLSVPVYVLVREERAKNQTLTFWRTNMIICSTVDNSALRGRTLYGGDIRPLGIKVRGGSRGGPWAPPTRFVILQVSCFLSRF